MSHTLSETLTVDLGSRSYPIVIGSRLLPQLGAYLQPLLPGRQVAIVSNTTVAPLYLEQVEEALQQQGFATLAILLPDGEAYKTWPHLQTLFDALIQNHFERSATLLALGGGVVGDMTGFAAATFLRGVNFVQIPTTLLAQVDASVGGKTGINHALGKNLIGAFYQPRQVLIDVQTLTTLPVRERLAGLAEVIKYGIIWDETFFQRLERDLDGLLLLQQELLIETIRTCCTIKAAVVAADERESEGGHRALLNLGHTFGHAIETLSGYGQLLHGEAVAMGMVMAADLSHRLGLCGAEAVARIRQLLARCGLPLQAPAFPVDAYLEAMGRDKKVLDGALRLVLVQAIGQAVIRRDIPLESVRQTIQQHLQATGKPV
ncbi:MAG: 3-dehydroquinate synthase [Magnetococcales bacterium]|nr:3-dehydroquinate synthase [Magnetococcales bacterium]